MADDEPSSPSEAPAGGVSTVFVVDASADAERVGRALSHAGFVVRDVPLSLLFSRLSGGLPSAVVLDGDAGDAEETLQRLRELPGAAALEIALLAEAGRRFLGEAQALIAGASSFFARPIDVPSLVERFQAHLVPVELGPLRVSSDPPSVPSARSEPSGRRDSELSSRALPPSAPSGGPGPPSLLSSPLELSGAEGASWGPPPSSAPLGLRLSDDLAQLLASAEERVDAVVTPSSEPPSPDAEVDAVLPAELLDALDEPLDLDDDLGSSSGSDATPGRAGSGHHRTSALTSTRTTGGGVASRGTDLRGVDGSDPQVTPLPRELTGGAALGDPGAALDQLTPLPRGVTASLEPTTPPPRRVRTPAPPHTGAGDEEAETPRPLRRASQAPLDGLLEPPRSLAPDTRAMPSFQDVVAERPPSAPPKTGPFSRRAARALGEGDALRELGRAISLRQTVCLCFDDGKGLRRVVLRDGDFLSASSTLEDESLVAFLVARGDLPAELARRLGGKLPPFGRHAGAALVANGHLAQDRLWEILRGHAEWLLARIVDATGACEEEPEAPGRLRNEPGVFGGSTGAEVLIEIARRAVPPPVALARLGGGRARLAEGPSYKLLGECALSSREVEALERARGATVAEAVEFARSQELAPVLLALAALSVLATMPAVERGSERPASVVDPLDEEALRARVAARLALVEEADYFSLLGLASAATPYELRRAYVELRRTFEPARSLTAATADLLPKVELILSVLDEAYEILRDPVRRERYRRAIEATPGHA